MVKRWFSIGLMLLSMSACHNLPVMTVAPVMVKKTTFFQVSDKNGNTLLIIEPYAKDQWRFIQVNSLGAPISRQIVHKGKWHNDGFLPPNIQARKLFIAVYTMLNQQKNGSPTHSDQFLIDTNQQSDITTISWGKLQWTIREIEND